MMDMQDLFNFSVASAPGGIEQQEADGQTSLVSNSSLPKDGNWELLRWGEEDDLFYSVRLPEGWRKVATSHSLYSDLLDDRGLKRATLMYKAAFYDRDANISPCEARFVASTATLEEGFQGQVVDLGLDQVLHSTQVGSYAFLKSNPTIVGFLFESVFHFETKGRYSDACFCEQSDGALADLLSVQEFYKRYHHVNPCHEVIGAAKSLVFAKAKESLKSLGLPEDKNLWWNPEFDISPLP